MAFTGSAAAFKDASATVNPSGNLSPGDTVSAVVKLTIPGGSESSVQLTSPLTNPVWHVDVIRGGVTITSTDGSKSPFTLGSMFVGIYDEDIQLEITMSGKVGSGLAGSTFKAVTVIETGSKQGGDSTFTTPDQTVYDPNTVTTSVAAEQTKISTIREDAVFYSAFGIDMTEINDQIASAESYLKSAESYLANNNLNAAYTALDNGKTAVTNADRGVARLALDKIADDVTETKAIIEELLNKNWTNEGSILSSKLTEVTSNYNLINTEYNAGNSPDCRETLQSAEDLHALADEYLLKSNSTPDILQYWWVLLIVLGVAAVVVGVIFIIKRRGGGWDELG